MYFCVVAFFSLVVFSHLIGGVNAQSEDSIPAMMLSNWFDSVLSWTASRSSYKLDPSKPVGVYDYRISDNWNYSALKADTFALIIGNEYYTDPKLWDGDTYLRDDGVFETTYNKYNGEELSFTVVCEIIQPAYAPHYVVRYKVNDPKMRSYQLLSYLIVDSNSSSAKTWAWYNLSENMFMADETKSGAFYFSSGAMNGFNSFQFGEVGTPNDPLTQFASGGISALGMNEVTEAQQVGIGIGVKGSFNKSYSFYRSYRKDYDTVVAASKAAANNDADYWIDVTKTNVDAWLSNARIPPSFKDEPFYKTSLLFLKHAQNPTVGTIVASFHPEYGFKVWMRDSLYAAMILDAAGYTIEARMFYTWASNNVLADGNHYHTCYNYWTGDKYDFVEPQLDSAGQYLLALLYHLSLASIKAEETGDETILDEAIAFVKSSTVVQRMGIISNYFINNKGKYNLAPADYSIWEESSSPVDGKPLSTGYFSYTQGLSWAGLFAAYRLYDEIIGDKNMADKTYQRSVELREAVNNYLWCSSCNGFLRQIWGDTNENDTRTDSSSSSLIWTGLITDETKIDAHMESIKSTLTRDSWGLARYDGDIYFQDSVFSPVPKECENPMPPWPVVTLMNSWIESPADRLERLKWAVDRAAWHSMPVGEAVDGDTDRFIWSSAPDIYEHAGIYVLTCLIHDGLVPRLRPEELEY